MPDITSDWVTRQVDTGIFNAAYVVWFHSGPVASGTPDGAEMVIWMRSRGGVRPGGSVVAENVLISAARWNVWLVRDGGRVRITYERLGEVTSVRGLDIRAFTMDSVARGNVLPGWYLVAVEAGSTCGVAVRATSSRASRSPSPTARGDALVRSVSPFDSAGSPWLHVLNGGDR